MYKHQVFNYFFDNIIVPFIPSVYNNILSHQFQYRCNLSVQSIIFHLKFQLFYTFIIQGFIRKLKINTKKVPRAGRQPLSELPDDPFEPPT